MEHLRAGILEIGSSNCINHFSVGTDARYLRVHLFESRPRFRVAGKSIEHLSIPCVWESGLYQEIGISIVRPNAEPPRRRTHKIGMPFRHAQVVDALVLPRVQQVFDRHPTADVRRQPLADLQFARRRPAAILRVERMLRRRADHLPADVQVHYTAEADEHLLHRPRRYQATQVVFVAGQHQVADLQFVDAPRAGGRQERRVAGAERGVVGNHLAGRWAGDGIAGLGGADDLGGFSYVGRANAVAAWRSSTGVECEARQELGQRLVSRMAVLKGPPKGGTTNCGWCGCAGAGCRRSRWRWRWRRGGRRRREPGRGWRRGGARTASPRRTMGRAAAAGRPRRR